MSEAADTLEMRVEALLASDVYAGHPLHEAMTALYRRYLEHIDLIEGVTRGPDESPDRAPAQVNHALRYRRQLRQIEKIIRISDHYQHMMRGMNQKLRDISDHDELTGLPNRRYMTQRLQQAWRRISESGKPFCVALADVDHFKLINDTFGHDVGDRALSAIAHCLAGNLRDIDLCARWGGEEFLLLLPGTTLAEAQRVLARLLPLPGAIDGVLPAGSAPITLSFGVSVCRDESETPEALLRRTDQALYRAKALGRNRIENG